MATKPKYPELHDEDWWNVNKDKTNVEISQILNCATSTVQFARYKMKIKPLSQKETTRRQWASIEFRKTNAIYSELYDKSFWKSNKEKTNMEIAKQIGCSITTVKISREIMGYKSLTRSEAQKRRYKRDGLPIKREEISNETRLRVMERAGHVCEVPTCSVTKGLEIHHLIKNSKDIDNHIALCFSHHIWIERSGIKVETYDEAIKILQKMFPN